MKFSKKLALLSLVLAGTVGMSGCKSNAKMPVSFVAVTSEDYNAEVTFGDYDYTAASLAKPLPRASSSPM